MIWRYEISYQSGTSTTKLLGIGDIIVYTAWLDDLLFIFFPLERLGFDLDHWNGHCSIMSASFDAVDDQYCLFLIDSVFSPWGEYRKSFLLGEKYLALMCIVIVLQLSWPPGRFEYNIWLMFDEWGSHRCNWNQQTALFMLLIVRSQRLGPQRHYRAEYTWQLLLPLTMFLLATEMYMIVKAILNLWLLPDSPRADLPPVLCWIIVVLIPLWTVSHW